MTRKLPRFQLIRNCNLMVKRCLATSSMGEALTRGESKWIGEKWCVPWLQFQFSPSSAWIRWETGVGDLKASRDFAFSIRILWFLCMPTATLSAAEIHLRKIPQTCVWMKFIQNRLLISKPIQPTR
ncbi:Uncharacterized protein TCM_034365 [Theobroma cacao]|uniref:Uncharacterized protein n=1 Tax=Theobroma cacao TaxID=3641 RepID=A0A061FEV9_THECC|nr:Uncharacterized protein TCM_034365 [Theobroma cacao]